MSEQTLDDAALAALREAAEAVVGELVVSDTDELIAVKVSGDPPPGRLTRGRIISAERALSDYLEAVQPATVLALLAALDAARAELARVTAARRELFVLLEDLADFRVGHMYFCGSEHGTGLSCDCGLELLLQRRGAALAAAPDAKE
jgi:hypothetical protein